MDTLLVQVFVMSQGSEPVIGQEHELVCRGACDVTGISGAVHVGMYMWLVQVVMMPQRAEPLIGQEQLPSSRAACDVSGCSRGC